MISVVAMILTLAVLQENHRRRLHGKPMIVAIEEPEVHLHPGAQRRYLDYFRWISEKHQTIITTHSPIFVNRAQPESVTVLRRANWHDQKHSARRGTNIKVGNTIAITNACMSTWRDITETLGIRLSDALMAGEVNLLVEGSTKFFLIPAVADTLGDKLGFAFDRVFVVNGEGGNLPHMARLLQGTQLCMTTSFALLRDVLISRRNTGTSRRRRMLNGIAVSGGGFYWKGCVKLTG